MIDLKEIRDLLYSAETHFEDCKISSLAWEVKASPLPRVALIEGETSDGTEAVEWRAFLGAIYRDLKLRHPGEDLSPWERYAKVYLDLRRGLQDLVLAVRYGRIL